MTLDLYDLRRREVQAIGAAISTRDWWALEQAYNAIRDKLDRAGFTVSGPRPTAALSPSPDAAPAGCTCVVAFGQDPSCPSHGRGTEWRAENPEADWRDDPAGARAALDLPTQAIPSTPKDQ